MDRGSAPSLMAHRRFTDVAGRDWDVWTVIPTKVERRTGELVPVPEDRREQHEYRAHLGPELSTGWLCFETKGEKRRLAPYPDDWEIMTNEQLNELLGMARKSAKPRRLIE